MDTVRNTLAERFNAEPLLGNDELFDMFSKVSLLLGDCLRVITQTSPSVALTIIEVGSEVAAKLQRNKSLFRRRVAYLKSGLDVDLKDVASDPDADVDAFLCECMDMALSLHKGEPPTKQVEQCRLNRMYTERFVRAFLSESLPLVDQTWATCSLYYHKRPSVSYMESAADCIATRRKVSLDHGVGFGVVQFVRDRIEAIDYIYNKITNAYARVILKFASSSAIDDDHFCELCQYGYFGLRRANVTYDYILNAKYVAVAKAWCRQSILYWMKASSGIIKISPSLWQHRARMEQARSKIITQRGTATVEEVAATMGVTPRYVETTYESVRTAQVSAFDPVVHDTQTVDAHGDSIQRDIQDILSKMTPKDRAYMHLLHNIHDNGPHCIPESDIIRHKLRQAIGRALTVDA